MPKRNDILVICPLEISGEIIGKMQDLGYVAVFIDTKNNQDCVTFRKKIIDTSSKHGKMDVREVENANNTWNHLHHLASD